jgi:hypothetical protein
MLDPTVHAKVSEIITAAQQSQHAKDLQFIISQVEKFYGEGWNTILWEVALIVGLLGTILGIFAPWYINNKLEKRTEHQIANAKAEAKVQTDKAMHDIQNLIAHFQATKRQIPHLQNAVAWVMKANRLQEKYETSSDRNHLTGWLDAALRAAIEYALACADEDYSHMLARLRHPNAIPLLNPDEAATLLSTFTPYIQKSLKESSSPGSEESASCHGNIKSIEQLIANAAKQNS